MKTAKRVHVVLSQCELDAIQRCLERLRSAHPGCKLTTSDALRTLILGTSPDQPKIVEPPPRKTQRPPILGDNPRRIYFTDGTSEPRDP